MVILGGESLVHEVVANANSTILDEIQIVHIVVFIKNKSIILGAIKLCWYHAKADIVEELGVLVLSRVEEKSMVVDNVIEQVVLHDETLNLSWALVKIFIILLNSSKSIVFPFVCVVLINLVSQVTWQGFLTKSIQQVYPTVKLSTLVDVSHCTIIIFEHLNELSHDLREEDDTTKHEYDTNNLFSCRNGKHITVSNS